MRILSAFVTGLMFGLGLAISGMTQPGKVLAFLDFTGAWNPSLAFVMGGALLVFAPTFFIVRKRRDKPVLEREFDLPTKKHVTPRLVVGASVFGVGWGLAGFCPGTAITTLPTGGTTVLTVVAGVVLGILATWGAQSAVTQRDVAVEADF